MKFVLFSVIAVVTIVHATPMYGERHQNYLRQIKRYAPVKVGKYSTLLNRDGRVSPPEKGDEKFWKFPLRKVAKTILVRNGFNKSRKNVKKCKRRYSNRGRRHGYEKGQNSRKSVLRFRSPEQLQEYLFSEAADAKHILRNGPAFSSAESESGSERHFTKNGRRRLSDGRRYRHRNGGKCLSDHPTDYSIYESDRKKMETFRNGMSGNYEIGMRKGKGIDEMENEIFGWKNDERQLANDERVPEIYPPPHWPRNSCLPTYIPSYSVPKIKLTRPYDRKLYEPPSYEDLYPKSSKERKKDLPVVEELTKLRQLVDELDAMNEHAMDARPTPSKVKSGKEEQKNETITNVKGGKDDFLIPTLTKLSQHNHTNDTFTKDGKGDHKGKDAGQKKIETVVEVKKGIQDVLLPVLTKLSKDLNTAFSNDSEAGGSMKTAGFDSKKNKQMEKELEKGKGKEKGKVNVTDGIKDKENEYVANTEKYKNETVAEVKDSIETVLIPLLTKLSKDLNETLGNGSESVEAAKLTGFDVKGDTPKGKEEGNDKQSKKEKESDKIKERQKVTERVTGFEEEEKQKERGKEKEEKEKGEEKERTKEKEKEMDREKEREREKEKQREREQERQMEKERQEEKEKERTKEKEKEMDREKEGIREKERLEKEKQRERERQMEKDREEKEKEKQWEIEKEKLKEKEKERAKEKEKEMDREKERERENERVEKEKQREREIERQMEKERQEEKEKERVKEREKEDKEKEKEKQREMERERQREKEREEKEKEREKEREREEKEKNETLFDLKVRIETVLIPALTKLSREINETYKNVMKQKISEKVPGARGVNTEEKDKNLEIGKGKEEEEKKDKGEEKVKGKKDKEKEKKEKGKEKKDKEKKEKDKEKEKKKKGKEKKDKEKEKKDKEKEKKEKNKEKKDKEEKGKEKKEREREEKEKNETLFDVKVRMETVLIPALTELSKEINETYKNVMKPKIREKIPEAGAVNTGEKDKELEKDKEKTRDKEKNQTIIEVKDTIQSIVIPVLNKLSQDLNDTYGKDVETEGIIKMGTESTNNKKIKEEEEEKDKEKGKEKEKEKEKERKRGKENGKGRTRGWDFPCKIDGTWTGTIDPLQLNITTLTNMTIKVNVLSESLRKGNCIGKDWTINGLTLSTFGGPFMFAAVHPEKKKLATFVGQCRTFREEDTIFGLWSFEQAEKECSEGYSSVETKTDIFIRDKMGRKSWSISGR